MPYYLQPTLYVLRRALKIAFVVDDIVFVEPNDFVHESFSPASFNKFLMFSPATMPRPLGPGIISIVTLPPFPRTLNGTEWSWLHLHSQLPQPSFTGMTLRKEAFVALSIETLICEAFPLPIPNQPASLPTATRALKRVISPASVCFWTMPTDRK